ncbi:MAG: hypothetical protein CMK99_22490 [Pseudomonas sp.]|nr:hypothetical protein [Pseudomonas sp.]|tara:strand:- start:3784 stop:4170 length:387 start_codon:yes stop_codon:yes gene_type:complete
MKITVSNVTPETVCIHGQTLAREYAELVLLPLLVAAEGQNHPAIVKVADAFATAGLSLEGSPEASRLYRSHQHQQRVEQERLKAEAEAHARRCHVPTPQEIAQQIAERERKAREIREHGERLRAARGR